MTQNQIKRENPGLKVEFIGKGNFDFYFRENYQYIMWEDKRMCQYRNKDYLQCDMFDFNPNEKLLIRFCRDYTESDKQKCDKSELDFNTIVELRLARKNELVKILGRGELKAKLKVSAHKFTATAKAAIEAAGGEVVTL